MLVTIIRCLPKANLSQGPFCEELLQEDLINNADQLAARRAMKIFWLVWWWWMYSNNLDHDLVLSATQIENILVEQEACSRRVYLPETGVYITFEHRYY